MYFSYYFSHNDNNCNKGFRNGIFSRVPILWQNLSRLSGLGYKTRRYQGQMIFRRSFVKWVPPQTIGKWNKGFYRVTTFVTPSGLFIIIIGLYLSVYWGTYEYCVSEKFSAWKPEFDCKYQFEACNIIVRQQRGLRCVLPSTIPGRALPRTLTYQCTISLCRGVPTDKSYRGN